jgi:hypothetical protein
MVCRNVAWLYLVDVGIGFYPPIPRRGHARAAAIRPTWATWKGFTYVGGGRVHLAWRLVAGGIVGSPFH